MSNNIKERNQELFDRLKENVTDEFIYKIVDDSSEPRRLYLNGTEMELLKRSKIEKIEKVFPNKPIYKIKYYNSAEDEQKYFVVIPDQSNEINETFMRGTISKLEENKAGLLTLIWSTNFPFSSKVSYDDLLYEKIFGSIGDFYLEDLQEFFIDCEIWEVDDILYNLDPYCIYGGWLTNTPFKLSLEFSSNNLLKYRQLFEESFGQLVGEPLFRSLTSTHFEHSFLESYRCIERLYHIPYIQELLLLTKDGTTTSALAAQIDQKLSWRPKEEAALGKLINILNDADLNYAFFLSLKIDKDKQTNPYSEADITELAITIISELSRLIQNTGNVAAVSEVTKENNYLYESAFDISTTVFQNELPKLFIRRKDEELIEKKVTKAIYSLRNNIAHWRPSGDNHKKPDDWENFIYLINDLVSKLYTHFKKDI